MRQRIKRIFENLGKNAPEAIFINYGGVKDYSFFYVTGFTGGSFEGSSAIIRKDGSCTAIIPQLEENTARKENGKNRLGNELLIFKTGKEHIDFLKKELREIKNIGCDLSALSVNTHNRLKTETHAKIADVGTAIRDARAIKDGIEIAKIREAVEIAEKAFERVIEGDVVEAGARESDVAAELAYQMQRIGGTPSFPTIVAGGKNSAEPHYLTGSEKLRKNQFVLIDWGAKFKRYNSDMTRTFALGRANEKQLRMFEVVEDAQEVAFDLMQEGVDAASVHSAVSDFISKTEFKGKFVHSTGHSLGLQVHDGKTLGNEKFELKENMVFTVEPGIYVSGIGGVRLEEDVLIRKNGIEKLSGKNRFFEL
ncbi:MAG: Xaa-Pro peptidase family protein [Candidatus Micrarchaeota archaeon]